MRIFLIGFMGSGKSSIGRELANKLGMHFIDLDEFIECKTQKKITDIFDEDGEEKFRRIEHECLEEVSLKENSLISTGGGTPCYHNNMELINKSGISIYIKLNSGILTSRLFLDKGKRPLIKRFGDKKELLLFIENILAEREPFYLKSTFVIDGKNINTKKIIEILDGAKK